MDRKVIDDPSELLEQFLTLILLLQGVDQTPEKSQIKVWHQIGHEFSILVKDKDKATSF